MNSFYDASDYGHFRCEGTEAVSFLHRLVTNNIEKLSVGEGQHNALLDRKGKVRSLFYLVKMSEMIVHGVAPKPVAEKTIGLFKEMIFADRVIVTDVSNDYHLFILLGEHYLEHQYMIVPQNEAQEAFQELLQKRTPVTKNLFDDIRIRSGIHEYGVDITEENILLEGNLAHTFVRGKGCYPGQEVIERILTYGKGKIKLLPIQGKKED